MTLPAAPSPSHFPSVTELLASASQGESSAVNALFARLYPEIKRAARAKLAQASGVAGLNTTALVHESFLRMADSEGLQGNSRGQFFAYVGRVLRSVVVDHIRAAGADKRGGEAGILLTLSAAAEVVAPISSALDLIAIDRALLQMQQLDPGLYQLLEMIGFAGTPIVEVAQLRGVARRTVERDLVKARALLTELMGDSAATVY
ncbi:ECF-type sigma factor [Roseateles albus]|uniref:ECF-type sigma factor n=1 Tax=Roseateles albus TaxID=2987525 RepID=A0ABT5K7P0_9BURK|nr:ECF-type sigma factor [Roseateles albus]MDC8769974.1 ECF-type sigma factor [Roseateles albus]